MKVYLEAFVLAALSGILWIPAAHGAEVHPYLRHLVDDEEGPSVPLKVGDEVETRISNSGESDVTPAVSLNKKEQNFKIKLKDGAS